jgi:hypothetical protein
MAPQPFSEPARRSSLVSCHGSRRKLPLQLGSGSPEPDATTQAFLMSAMGRCWVGANGVPWGPRGLHYRRLATREFTMRQLHEYKPPTHSFITGSKVSLSKRAQPRNAALGPYKIFAQLPERDGQLQYRVKSGYEPFTEPLRKTTWSLMWEQRSAPRPASRGLHLLDHPLNLPVAVKKRRQDSGDATRCSGAVNPSQ